MREIDMNISCKKLIAAALASFAMVQMSCTMSDKPAVEKTEKSEVKFYSAADPGMWESKAAEHDVDITITKVNDKKILNVRVPFAKDRDKRHYIEAIVLLDANRNELQKKSFHKSSGDDGAQFEVPADFNTPVYVVMKCNLHDMWEKLVTWDE
jgi:desulfoferrodoxin (superoxide reductase-like protein)